LQLLRLLVLLRCELLDLLLLVVVELRVRRWQQAGAGAASAAVALLAKRQLTQGLRVLLQRWVHAAEAE
jgi:hypothetical protein